MNEKESEVQENLKLKSGIKKNVATSHSNLDHIRSCSSESHTRWKLDREEITWGKVVVQTVAQYQHTDRNLCKHKTTR